MNTPVLEINQVSKKFRCNRPFYKYWFGGTKENKNFNVLDGVTFSVGPGEIVGIVGPNGAGKTTLMRIISDLIAPDSGCVKICGETLKENNGSARKKIGFISSDERCFFGRLTGEQNLEFFSLLYGVARKDILERVPRLLDELDLSKKGKELFRDYSTGTKKKLSFIRAILHQPRLVLLDEVTNSLDLESAQKVKMILKDYIRSQKNASALWCTHRLEELGEICDRILTIQNGHVKLHDSLRQTREGTSSSHAYRLQVRNLNGNAEHFSNYCESMVVSKFKCLNVQNTHEFVFENISSQEFGTIIAAAVKDFNAQVLFAGLI